MRIGPGLRLAIVGLGLALAAGDAAHADGQAIKTIHHKARTFRIPVTIDPARRAQYKEIQLWVSNDAGITWSMARKTTTDQPWFNYEVPADGEYWFATRTIDVQGRPYPPDEKAADPGLKVVIDTTPPLVELAARNRRGSTASVRWEVRGEHLKLDTMTLEYRVEGSESWAPVPIRQPALIGAESWDANTAARLTARLRIRDEAGNIGEASVALPDGIATDLGPASASDDRDFAPPPIVPIATRSAVAPGRSVVPAGEDDGFGPPDDGGPVRGSPEPTRPEPAPAAGAPMIVGSPRFNLQYEVEDAGPSGPALVELWVTNNGGRTWRRQSEDRDRVSPYPVDLGGEGTFGLWLVVQGASNLGDPPPAPGDRPQMWVEVDMTPPVVRLDPPRVGYGKSAGKVLINWKATDAHLARDPVVLSYREDAPGAPWKPITGRIPNSGRYVWNVPPATPARVHIRVDVVDLVHNRGSAETTDTGRPIVIDRSRPKGRIIGLETPGRGGAETAPRR